MARPGEFAAEAPDRVERALSRARAEVEDPRCAVCGAPADFFLYEPERVREFVCWEHVSPVAAVVGEAEAVDRPLAVALSEEFASED